MREISRRVMLQMTAWGTAVQGWILGPRIASAEQADNAAQAGSAVVGNWSQQQDRVWLGPEFWANPMEDWKIFNGAAEVRTGGGDRNIHLLTHRIEQPRGALAMSVEIEVAEQGEQDGGAGFKLGINSEIDEYRSSCFAKNGFNAGLIEGQLALAGKRVALENPVNGPVTLHLTGTFQGEKCQLQLTATDAAGTALGKVENQVDAEQLRGNVALVSHYRANIKPAQGTRYRFRNWQVSGEAFTVEKSRQFGPILWSMYSLSDSRSEAGFVLKLAALVGPVGLTCKPTVELQIQTESDGKAEWKSLGTTAPDAEAWTALFRIPQWPAEQQIPYRLIYTETLRNGQQQSSIREGVIQANPSGRPLKIGALTCQNDYAFPYAPVAENLQKLNPDLLYFSGDQLYENHGGYGVIRDDAELAILNYLRKFYQFGWAFGEVMRNRPTLCIPDDHDVFQGNLWGEGGKKLVGTSTSSFGGYIQPARMVNVVHRSCTAHHPDFYDETPVKQGISSYYGDMVYGNVGFAIIADRQWKSGPEHVETGPGRPDHVLDADFDTSTLDKPGLILLGERQEQFLQHWAEDWRGHTIKVLLSQTVFSGLATHHGGYDGYLKADLDAGAWPQTARNRTVQLLRQAKPLHINGDQHLTTLSQYGVEQQRDGCWAFCTPAIAVGYPRWWRPDELDIPHQNRPAHGLPHTGEYLDSFGNKTYVYAVGNPQVGTAKNRYERAEQKGSGFGFVTVDPAKKTYFIEAYRFLIDATDGKPENQYPGWPVTIHQQENGGENLL